MSYYAIQGLGEFVAVAPGSGLLGLGAAASFDGAQAWSDWVSGDTSRRAGTPNGLDNQAAKNIQAQLNALGYGPLVVDGIWGPASSAAYYAFATKNNVSVNTGCPGPGGAKGSCPTKDGLVAMGAGGVSKASLGMMIGLGVAAAALAGILAVMAKKKGHPARA
jgi:peptidoglycan hydrolase-like protein with peptidoglycan-binding domain